MACFGDNFVLLGCGGGCGVRIELVECFEDSVDRRLKKIGCFVGLKFDIFRVLRSLYIILSFNWL